MKERASTDRRITMAGGVGNERINTDGRIADAGGVSK
jgi:hypothetical protein